MVKIGAERFSVPFFLEPKYDVEIRRLVLPEGKAPEEKAKREMGNVKMEEEAEERKVGKEEEEATDWEVVRQHFLTRKHMHFKYGPWMVQNLQRIEEFRLIDFGIL